MPPSPINSDIKVTPHVTFKLASHQRTAEDKNTQIISKTSREAYCPLNTQKTVN